MKSDCLECGASFKPKRAHALFCSPACRATHNRKSKAKGPVGRIAGIRKLRNGGVSVTVHFRGPDAGQAMNYEHGALVEVTRI